MTTVAHKASCDDPGYHQTGWPNSSTQTSYTANVILVTPAWPASHPRLQALRKEVKSERDSKNVQARKAISASILETIGFI